jgi:hypothetical protein
MNSINLEVINGHWSVNDKPLKNCSIAKKNFFAQFVKMRLVKSEVSQNRTFKQKAEEVKRLYNYKFANLHDDNLENYPNIETLTFERKTT